jgi:DNA-binding transcriptional MerR regulator
MQDLELLAIPRERAAALSGLSVRQIGYWDRTGLLHPAVDARLTPHRPIRLYGFNELMSLLVIAELRRRGVSLQHVRRIVALLRDRGYTQPLTQVRYATGPSGIYVQHEDGSWVTDIALDQLVIHEVLDLEPLVARVRSLSERDPDTVGRIDRRRATLGSKPLVAGTRIPVATIRRFLEHGATVAEVLEAYPILVEQDVEAVQRELSVACADGHECWTAC